MQVGSGKIVVLGTGGTIAGASQTRGDEIGYAAGQVAVAQLLRAVPGLATAPQQWVAEQVAQIDSKDMDWQVWRSLALRCAHWLGDAGVAGIVITHGTDTLEETAFFLQMLLAPPTPVVLACAMRPSDALAPDGPQNLADAFAAARAPGACGVTAVCAGRIHGAVDVQKVHTYRLDAFGSGDAGPLGYVEAGQVRMVRDWPAVAQGLPLLRRAALLARLQEGTLEQPRVEVITSHAGADGRIVDALLAAPQPPQGIVVAATGNGTIHHLLNQALARAAAAGVRVVRATRCAEGRVIPAPRAQGAWQDSRGLSAVKARIALMLELAAPDC
ncbi:asparaginase [Ramlibacter sp. H39-3-26]|uniref:asparaginase n=1 Tax=Curvibacter soli TaxID=3031331 RepID=UPI0023D9CEAA|nr:asparaginase [Ramlibacter sp. H39-3-26]MDF1484385.1 asparaginase [Ramlibacter sp. H39-3-26]